MKYKASASFLKSLLIAGVVLIAGSGLFLCPNIWSFWSREISLFDVLGMKTNSLRFLHAGRVLDLVTVDGTMIQSDLLKNHYPAGESYYVSERLPIVVVEKNGAVDVLRVGFCGDLRDVENNGYVVSPDLLRCITSDLGKINVRMPYELIVADDVESTINVFRRPYVEHPSRLVEGDLVCLDFVNVTTPDYWPIVLYFVRDKLVGFEITRDEKWWKAPENRTLQAKPLEKANMNSRANQ